MTVEQASLIVSQVAGIFDLAYYLGQELHWSVEPDVIRKRLERFQAVTVVRWTNDSMLSLYKNEHGVWWWYTCNNGQVTSRGSVNDAHKQWWQAPALFIPAGDGEEEIMLWETPEHSKS